MLTILPNIDQINENHEANQIARKMVKMISSSRIPNFDFRIDYEFLVNCTWRTIKSAKNLLGFCYIINIPQKQNEEEIQNFYDEARKSIRRPDFIEFKYSEEMNGFYQKQHVFQESNENLLQYSNEFLLRHATHGKYPTKLNKSATNSVKENENMQHAENEEIIDKIPLIFRNMLPLVKRICETSNDEILLHQLLSRVSYSDSIQTYRLENGNVRKINEASCKITIEDSSFIYENDEDRRNDSENEKESIKYMRSTIKNKAYLEKTIQSVPVPKSFFWIIMISCFSVILAIAISISQYVIYMNLKNDSEKAVQILFHVPYQVKTMMESTNYIIQELALFEYFFYIQRKIKEVSKIFIQYIQRQILYSNLGKICKV